jgi:hypothetical protein
MIYKPQAIIFLKKTLGEDGFEELNKVELYKKKTNTVLDHEEIKTALQIVPRTILSFLQKELGEMKENEGKEIKIPVEPEAFLSVTKFANDVYSGEIRQKGEIVSSFKYRSLPGVGLVIMSAFELYDIDDLNRMGKQSFSDSLDVKRIQDIIDEKLRMRDLISKVVEEKLSQRQAIEELVKMRLSQMLLESSSFSDKNNDLEEEEKEKEEKEKEEKEKEEKEKEEKEEKEKELKMEKKPSKLKQFLERKAAKKSKPSYEIRIEKSESVICPDCGNKIFDEKSGFSGCVCFGPDRNKKIHIKKSENGIKLSFSKQWDPENIEMLLEVLRERRNRSKNG